MAENNNYFLLLKLDQLWNTPRSVCPKFQNILYNENTTWSKHYFKKRDNLTKKKETNESNKTWQIKTNIN